MQCPVCAAENPAEHLFCDACGAQLTSRCASCGATGRPEAHFCGRCGAPLGGPPTAPTETSSVRPSHAGAAELGSTAFPASAGEAGPSPFLGRERELTILVDLFERARAGEGQIVCITGAAGSGKSRLIRELRRQIASGDMSWLEGRCGPSRQFVALHPCIEQLRQLFDVEESDSRDEIVARIEAWIEPLPELAEHAPYIRSLLVEWAYDSEEPMDDAQRRARVFDAVRALTIGAVERPTVLVFEDLHWLDPSSGEFLATNIDAVTHAPVLLIATHRSGYTPPFDAGSAITTLTLDRLSASDATSPAAAGPGQAPFPPRLSPPVSERAEGVPLWIEEVTRAFLIPSMAEIDLPATHDGIVAARLERLSEGARRILQLCSVTGSGASRQLLERMAERPAQLDGWLAELEREDFLYGNGREQAAYTVKHEVVESVAYHSALPARRTELHRAAAAAIEELAAERVAEHYADLSRHWEIAEQWSKAMQYAERAGDQAAQIDANSEAREHYTRALRAAQRLRQRPEPERFAALLSKCAWAEGALGAHADGLDHFARALALAREVGDRNAELEALVGTTELYEAAHRPEDAQLHRDQAFALAEELDDRAAQAACLTGRAESIATWQGPTADARRAARSAVELAERVNDPALRARALVVLGSVLQWRADFDACQRYLQEGATLAERTHRSTLLGQALFHLGHAHRARGRYLQALRWYGDAHDHAERANDTVWIARAPGIAASVYLELYDANTAIDLCREGEEIAERL